MTFFFDSAGQVLSTFLIFLLGLGVAIMLHRYFRASLQRSLVLYFWHTFFCLVYALYVIKYGGDALGYYRYSFSPDLSLALGTLGVRYLTSFLSQGFGLSFFGCSLVFQFFGFVGLLAVDASLREVTKYKSRRVRFLATLFVFLPSASFWSAGLGKDALSFFAVGLALWAALNTTRRWCLFVISISVMLLVRPHMAALLGIGLVASLSFRRNISLGQRVWLGGIAVVATAMLLPVALNYAGLGSDPSANQVMSYIDSRQESNLGGGSSVNIANMILPVQMFTYLFRPLPIEAKNLFSMVASLENLILMYIFIKGILEIWRGLKRKKKTSYDRVFLWAYGGASWVILSMTTANLGIAARQKWMFLPMLILLFLSSMKNLAEESDQDTRKYGLL